MAKFDHLVCVDEAVRELLIYRIDAEGERSLTTKVPLPETAGWSPSWRPSPANWARTS